MQKRRAKMRKKTTRLNQAVKVYPLFLWGVLALFSSMAYAEEKAVPKLVFKLTQDQNTQICKVYLQRLNTTALLRAEEGLGNQLSGLREVTKPLKKDFEELNSTALSAEEIQRIYYKIISFNHFRAQDLLEKHRELGKNDWIGSGFKKRERLPEKIKEYINNDKQNPFVRYQKKLDMDNDGIATDTVVENRFSVYIVDESLQRIDETKMMAIFADQELLEWPTIAQFPPLTMLTNVFKYQGKYYFGGFIDLSLNSQRGIMLDDKPPLKIGIFIHQQQKTQKVCEYQILNEPNDYRYIDSYPYYE
jgi:hypothetical protein